MFGTWKHSRPCDRPLAPKEQTVFGHPHFVHSHFGGRLCQGRPSSQPFLDDSVKCRPTGVGPTLPSAASAPRSHAHFCFASSDRQSRKKLARIDRRVSQPSKTKAGLRVCQTQSTGSQCVKCRSLRAFPKQKWVLEHIRDLEKFSSRRPTTGP